MADDKNTIGVTATGSAILEEVVHKGLFGDQMDAAKFAIALAIRSGIEPGEAVGANTKWNVGSFDKDGHLRATLTALFPAIASPYRLSEYLIDRGLVLLSEELAGNPDLDVGIIQKRLASARSA
jgi:hypothetical protein